MFRKIVLPFGVILRNVKAIMLPKVLKEYAEKQLGRFMLKGL